MVTVRVDQYGIQMSFGLSTNRLGHGAFHILVLRVFSLWYSQKQDDTNNCCFSTITWILYGCSMWWFSNVTVYRIHKTCFTSSEKIHTLATESGLRVYVFMFWSSFHQSMQSLIAQWRMIVCNQSCRWENTFLLLLLEILNVVILPSPRSPTIYIIRIFHVNDMLIVVLSWIFCYEK